MRFVFVNKLINYSKKNKNVYLITSDLGYRAFEKFAKLFPKRFINVGVSENNMIGIAAGMAASGKKIFVYSILPFVVFRSLEQIRNNIVHNNLDVNIIGAGGGFSFGSGGEGKKDDPSASGGTGFSFSGRQTLASLLLGDGS